MSNMHLWQGDLSEDGDECVECYFNEANHYCKKCHAPMCSRCFKAMNGTCSDCADNVLEGKLAFDDASGGRGISR